MRVRSFPRALARLPAWGLALVLSLAAEAILPGCAAWHGKKSATPGADGSPGSAPPERSVRAQAAPFTHPPNDSIRAGTPAGPGAPSARPASQETAAKSPPKAARATPGKPSPGVSQVPANAAPVKGNEPLIMENADRMEGFRSRGEYVLSGKVRFSHGPLRLETERAVWLKDQNLVYCESGMRIVQRGAVLTADKGSYSKNLQQANAEGHVRMRDSSGEVEAFANNLTYHRSRHLAVLTGNPELRRYYPSKQPSTPTVASTPKSASTPAADAGKPDTLVIRGETMSYEDSLQVALAEGKVRITRDKMKIDCLKAEYHDRSDSLFLLGDPQVVVDESLVKGKTMRLGMHGEEISSLLVKGDAQANSMEPATDTSVARQSNVRGDSLFLAFKEKAIDSVQVFRNATGSYFDVDKPDFVNRMSGDYMVLRFAGKQIASANVLGGAKSTYFHFEKKKLKGKNETEGDTIDFAFREGKVDEVVVKGEAKGVYYGEPEGKNDSAKAAGPVGLPVSGRKK